MNKSNTLIARDSKGKVRQINISCEKKDDSFVITRSSGLYGGKFINQPDIIITKGKAKRTLEEQAELEYNSNIKNYLDKGYKNIISLGYNDISEFNPDEILPKVNTDQSGIAKPMLCKVLDRNNKKLTDKQ